MSMTQHIYPRRPSPVIGRPDPIVYYTFFIFVEALELSPCRRLGRVAASHLTPHRKPVAASRLRFPPRIPPGRHAMRLAVSPSPASAPPSSVWDLSRVSVENKS